MARFQSRIPIKFFQGLLLAGLTYCCGLMMDLPPCPASQDAPPANTLVVCIYNPIQKLDPAIHRDRDTQVILKNMMDALTTRDHDMNVVPQLAESWKRLDDTSWEFRLRSGVKFHNNDEFTAEDVKFSLDRIIHEGGIEGETSPRKSLLGPVSKVTVIDRYTVVVKTEKLWPILPLMLSLQEIVPKKHMTRVGSAAFQSHPVGTGPFKFVRLEKNHFIEMERFEDYYGDAPDMPPVQNAHLKSLVFKWVPSAAEQIRQLKKGECHIISNIKQESIPILEASPDIKILSCPATRSYFAEINCNKPQLNDPRIRRALNHAVDIKQVIHHLLKGNGIALPTVLLPNATTYNKDLKPYAYNPALAKKILADAGFDTKHILQIYCTGDELQFANLISSFLTRAGLKSKIQIVNWELEDFKKQTQWDISLGSWGNSTLDPVGIIVPKFQTRGRGNFSGYSNREVDRLLVLAEGTKDLSFRETCYKNIQEIIYKDAPMIFGYAAKELFGIRKEVNNFIPSSSGMMDMHDVFIANGSGQ